MANENYTDARTALNAATAAAEKIADPVRKAEILTQIGHGFIRLGTEPFTPQRNKPKDDTGAGFQPHSGQDDR